MWQHHTDTLAAACLSDPVPGVPPGMEWQGGHHALASLAAPLCPHCAQCTGHWVMEGAAFQCGGAGLKCHLLGQAGVCPGCPEVGLEGSCGCIRPSTVLGAGRGPPEVGLRAGCRTASPCRSAVPPCHRGCGVAGGRERAAAPRPRPPWPSAMPTPDPGSVPRGSFQPCFPPLPWSLGTGWAQPLCPACALRLPASLGGRKRG